ncbi:unnamed protein product [Pylaiella littoralis]
MKTALAALLAVVGLSPVRSACEDVDTYFGSISRITSGDADNDFDLAYGASEVNLGLLTKLECPSDEDTEIVIVIGTDLTIKSDIDAASSVQFKNIRFTVEEGASLVFEMYVQFGPNSQEAYSNAFRVHENSSVTFMSNFHASGIQSAFRNSGLVEFKASSLFNDNLNVFYINTGDIKFRDNAVFKDNAYHGIENHSTGFVRFSKKATFTANGATFDDTSGCGLENYGTVIFRGDATFENHTCREAAAVYNAGKMRFYGKTIFNDNINEDVEGSGSGLGQGGGLRTWDGSDLIFKGDVEFNRNTGDVGGGFAVVGGDVRFREAVSFTDNSATMDGGGFAVVGGSVTFRQPSLVTGSGNQAASECSFGYVEEGGALVGFGDEACEESTAFGA